jgi:hypothetical protein
MSLYSLLVANTRWDGFSAVLLLLSDSWWLFEYYSHSSSTTILIVFCLTLAVEVCERGWRQFKYLLGENFSERERKVHEPCTHLYLRSEGPDDVLPTAMDRAPEEVNGVTGHGRLRSRAATSGISVRSR